MVLEYSDSDSADDAEEDSSVVENASHHATRGAVQSSKYQENTINVDKPSESPTTIIINNGPSTSHCIDPLTHSVPTAQEQCQFTGATDLARGPQESPVQPHINFPSTSVGSKKRSFNSEWYKKYNWLEYSKVKDAAFCYPCRLLVELALVDLQLMCLLRKVLVIGNMLLVSLEARFIIIVTGNQCYYGVSVPKILKRVPQ